MKERLLTIYNNAPIRNKILLIYLPVTIMPLILLALFSNAIYETSIIERTLRAEEDHSNLIIQQLESYLGDASDSATMLTININNIIDKYEEEASNHSLALYNAISNELTYSTLIFPIIDHISYLDTQGVLHSTSQKILNKNQPLLKTRLVTALEATTGPDYWFPMERRDYLTEDPAQPVVSLGKKVIDIQTGQTLGYLFINLNASTLSDVFKDQTTHFFILDESNRIIASADTYEILSPLDTTELNRYIPYGQKTLDVIQMADSDKMVVSRIPFTHNDWSLAGTVELKYLTEDLNNITLVIAAMLMVILIVVILSFRIISNIITQPIGELTRNTQLMADGNLQVRNPVNGTDEIGSLSTAFNDMTEKIHELLSKITMEQNQKREYELALIQEQIKPHFLYNCLDAIYALSMMGRQKDAAKTTKALADYYRLSLSKGQDIISLKDELSNVTNYLELQKIRYADVFDYEIHVNPKLLSQPILKLILQPLVENAIYHGLKPRDEKGFIRIYDIMDQTTYKLIVTDNGQGIPKDILDNLFTQPSNSQHFGLYNVRHRIQLFFGPEYGLKIMSQEGSGTTITLSFPFKEEAHD